MLRSTVSVVCLILLVTTAGGPTESPDGFLLTLEVKADECRLGSVASIGRFSPNRHRSASDDWRVELLDDLGQVVWRGRLRNPWAASPLPSPGQSVRFSARIPRLTGATEAVFRDHTGVTRLNVVLDGAFVEVAQAARRQFLEHDAANRARLKRWRAADAEKRSHGSGLAAKPRYKHLDVDIRAHLDSQVAREVELARVFGISSHEAARSGGNLAAASALHRTSEERQHGGLELIGQVLKVANHTLSGTIRDVETSEPIGGANLYFYQYGFDWEYQRYLGEARTSSVGRYAMTVGAGYVVALVETPESARYARKQAYTMIRGDTVLDASLFPGVLLNGNVIDARGFGIAGARVRATGSGFVAQMDSTSSGYFQLVVPRNQEITVRVQPETPYAEPYPVDLSLSGDQRRNFTLERGHVISGRVTGPGSGPISEATVIVRHLASSSCATRGWSLETEPDGSYSCAVPRDLRPSSYLLSVQADGFVRYSGSLSVVDDTSADVTLVRGFRVSGTITDSSGAPLGGAIIRVYRQGVFLTSATSEADGSYDLGLEPDRYAFRVTPFAEDVPSPMAPAEALGIEVGSDMELDFTLVPSDAVVTLRLVYPSADAAELSQGVVRIEVRRDGVPILVTFDSGSEVFLDPGDASFFRQTRLYLEAGLYDIVVYPIGCHPLTLSGIVASGETSIEHTLPEPFRWSGVLRAAEGDVLPGLPVISYDDLAVQSTLHSSDEDGLFSVPLTPGGTLRFFSPEEGSSMRRIERIAGDVESRHEDCYLDGFPEVVDSGGVLTQIWGTGDTDERYNLVIIGDGYTDISESFTDLNANGMWDAVLYYDLNGNGVLDRGSGERYTVYGAAQEPQEGTDPAVDNEPFVDLNGDGFPNLDDQANFDHNSLAVVRSLFGSDVWWRYRDAFNVYRIRVISEQAGHDILDEDYEVFLERDTALNTYIYDPSRRYILAPDYGIVEQYINEYTPFADTRIVLMNQPVQIGRATSYIITRGGPYAQLANYYVMSHEMGHNVGLLADEYTEFPETYEGPELLRPNITTFTERDRIPWADLIDEEKEIPSLGNTPGVGLFEGAYYQPNGVYRPVQRCTMNGSERFCPVCTREIEFIVAGLGSTVHGNAELIAPMGNAGSLSPRFEWTGPPGASHYRLELTADDDDEFFSFDVYATHLDLGFRLRPDTGYSWRVMPASGNRWGTWSELGRFSTQLPAPRSGGRRVAP